jgi:hypothetical protein
MPGTGIPVIRQPYADGDRMPMWAGGRSILDNHHVYDLSEDPDEQENRVGESVEADLAELVRVALGELEAPPEQLVRLGLA